MKFSSLTLTLANPYDPRIYVTPRSCILGYGAWKVSLNEAGGEGCADQGFRRPVWELRGNWVGVLRWMSQFWLWDNGLKEKFGSRRKRQVMVS